MSCAQELRFVSTLMIVLGVFMPCTNAKPLYLGGQKSPTYAKNSVLNVFVQVDPDGLGRHDFVKEGVERWTQPLADRMITLNVTIGNPPAGTTNPIHYQWVQDGSQFGDKTIGPGQNDAIGVPSAAGGKLVGGRSFVRRGLPGGTNDTNKNLLRNIGEHEMVHLLGMSDYARGDVMDHVQSGAVRTLNNSDLKELNALYGTKTSGGAKKARGAVDMIDGSASQGFYTYRFEFEPANLTPVADDPEHVAFIMMNVNPGLVTAMDLPPGWIGLMPTNPLSVNDPFFLEYMEDGFIDPPPWDPLSPLDYLALRTSSIEEAIDGLPPTFDSGLTVDNPFHDFTIYTNGNAIDGQVQIWAGGDSQTASGPVAIPTPTSLALLISALSFFACKRMRPTLRAFTMDVTQ